MNYPVIIVGILLVLIALKFIKTIGKVIFLLILLVAVALVVYGSSLVSILQGLL